jgi:hypothetical protein
MSKDPLSGFYQFGLDADFFPQEYNILGGVSYFIEEGRRQRDFRVPHVTSKRDAGARVVHAMKC